HSECDLLVRADERLVGARVAALRALDELPLLAWTALHLGVLHRGVARSSSRVALASGRGGLPLLRGELDLSQPDALRRHLDALVLADQLERLLERERPRRDQAYGLVRARRPHVRQLLLLGGVHVEVVGPSVLAHDHALVELHTGRDEERAALLQVEDRERGGGPAAVGDEGSRRACAQLAVPRLPALEDMVEDAGPARLGEELRAEADEPARRHEILETGPPGAVVDHLAHASLAEREQLCDDADVVLRDVDRDALDRLVRLAVDRAR